MNNTELTLDQLAEVSAAGLFINTNSNALNFRVINPSEASLKAGDLLGKKGKFQGEEIHLNKQQQYGLR